MKTKKRVTVIINGRPHHFESAKLCPDDFRKAVGADGDYEIWQVVGRPDPEGQLPQDDVQVTDCIEVKSGERFKVVPPGTFGALKSAPTLDVEVEEVRALGLDVEVHPLNNAHGVLIKGYALPTGYSASKTDLLIIVPHGYPHANPDMFWTETGVLLKNGGMPQNADTIEDHLGRKWRRFSWHINQRWHPGRDNLVTYLGFVEARLAKKV